MKLVEVVPLLYQCWKGPSTTPLYIQDDPKVYQMEEKIYISSNLKKYDISYNALTSILDSPDESWEDHTLSNYQNILTGTYEWILWKQRQLF